MSDMEEQEFETEQHEHEYKPKLDNKSKLVQDKIIFLEDQGNCNGDHEEKDDLSKNVN